MSPILISEIAIISPDSKVTVSDPAKQPFFLLGADVGPLGVAVGAYVGPLGVAVGAYVGPLGVAVGTAVGAVGVAVGTAVGAVGVAVGTAVGAVGVAVLGFPVGAMLGAHDKLDAVKDAL